MRFAGCHDGQRIIYSTVLSGCMCTRENVCGIRRANGAYIYINVTILSAVRSRPLTQVSFHMHYFASYFDITYLDIHHIACKIARPIV